MTAEFAIHDHITPRKPLYVRVPKPSFNTTYEKDKYWDEQRRRWHEGYSGLTGLHYFHIQEAQIPDAYGRPIRPIWRDGDSLVCDSFKQAQNMPNGFWDLYVMKRREFGLSSLFGGTAPIFYSLLNPGGTSFMTSADKDRIKLLYDQKLMTVYNNLDPDIKSPKARTKQGGYLFLADEYKKGEFRGLKSEIYCKDTVKNPQAPEAFRLTYLFLDELFLHPFAGKVRASGARCFMDGAEKIGSMVMGGSCGIGTTAGIEEGKKIYIDSKARRILTVFIKGTWCLKQFSTNGWSDEKAALEWVMRNRDELETAQDKTDYWKFVADYPLSEEEVLNMTVDSILPQEIQIMLKQSEKSIIQENIQDNSWAIERKPEGGLKAVPSVTGKFHILEPPQQGRQYGAGLDPIPFGNASIGEGSDLALIIKDRHTNRHVAYYKERNMDIDAVFHNCTLLQDLYFGVPALLELNRGEALYIKYREMGRLDLMCNMPTSLGIKYEKRKYPHGVNLNNMIETRCNNYMFMFLYANANNIRMKALIEDLKRWTNANTDLLSAALMEILDHANSLQASKRVAARTVTTQTLTVVRDADGRTHRKFVDNKVSLQEKSIGQLLKEGVDLKGHTNYQFNPFKRL